MTTVFLSGSRKISRLSEEVRLRLDRMTDNHLKIVTGDANGADKAMQGYLAEKRYPYVTIYFVGDAPRNNVGKWPTCNVIGDKKLSGRDFYAQKDNAMSKIADYGLVLWDGKSSGSVQNMIWLLEAEKAVVVFVAPRRRFATLRTQDEFVELLSECDNEVLEDIGRKIALPESLRRSDQTSLRFHS